MSIWQHPDAQEEGESAYEAETENMDGVSFPIISENISSISRSLEAELRV